MIKDYTQTSNVMNMLFSSKETAWEERLFEDTDFAMELDNRNAVLEGIIVKLNALGYSFSKDDTSLIYKEIKRRYRIIGIEEGTLKAVENWIKKNTPVNPSYHRENLYNLCLALEMNYDEICEFFLKNYMTIPFNYKDRVDATYFYGIKHNKTYIEINELLARIIENQENKNSPHKETKSISSEISDIDQDEVFLEYIENNTFSQEEQFKTARDIIVELISRCVNLLAEGQESYSFDETEKPEEFIKNGEPNIKAFLDYMYNYSNQKKYLNHDLNIAKSKYLPRAFKKNFPNDVEISKVKKGTATADIYRKTLIIMNFFNFYLDDHIYIVENDKKTIINDFKDFIKETSAILEKCGFVQMYARNPFDWLIMYCARMTFPIEAFQKLLSERFTNRTE